MGLCISHEQDALEDADIGVLKVKPNDHEV